MFCHLVFYVRLVLTTLTVITCLFGDNYIEVSRRHPILTAFTDNATHAVIGALSGISFVIHFYDKISNVTGWLIILGCFVISSIIDIDHFIEAKSFSLEAATTLQHRPFLHCSTIVVFFCFIYVTTACLNYIKTCLVFGTFLIAFITHHTRDAIRHGYWFCPFGHTQNVPYHGYLLLTLLSPHLVYYMYVVSRSDVVQNILGTSYASKISKYSIV